MVMLQKYQGASKNYTAFRRWLISKAKILTNSIQGLELEIDNRPVWFKLIGDFNAYNLLAVYGTGYCWVKIVKTFS